MVGRISLLVLLLSSCASVEVKLDNLACTDDSDCVRGWECDPATGTCVAEGTGDAPRGDPRAGDPIAGDPVSGDAVSGDSLPGDPVSGDPLPGDPLPGDPLPGDPLSGDPLPGDPLPGDPSPGDPLPGDPLPGDPLPGDPLPGDPLPGDPLSPTCIRWEADFSSDPTQLDVNGDGVDDWTIRDGSSFPTAELSEGVWEAAAGSGPLDSQPNNDFTGPTTVEVHMRPTDRGAPGAVFWINVDYADGEFAPLVVNISILPNGTRVLRLRGKSDPDTYEQLAELSGLGSGMQTIGLTITPATNGVAMSLNGTTIASATYSTIQPQSNDRFATLFAWGAPAEFDYIMVETCDP